LIPAEHQIVNVIIDFMSLPRQESLPPISSKRPTSATEWELPRPEGHESIAEASAWVYIFNDPALTRRYLVAHWLENTRSAGLEVLKGRQKSTRALNVSPDPEQIHGFNPGSPDNNN
jgi:hypothetical protein